MRRQIQYTLQADFDGASKWVATLPAQVVPCRIAALRLEMVASTGTESFFANWIYGGVITVFSQKAARAIVGDANFVGAVGITSKEGVTAAETHVAVALPESVILKTGWTFELGIAGADASTGVSNVSVLLEQLEDEGGADE